MVMPVIGGVGRRQPGVGGMAETGATVLGNIGNGYVH